MNETENQFSFTRAAYKMLVASKNNFCYQFLPPHSSFGSQKVPHPHTHASWTEAECYTACRKLLTKFASQLNWGYGIYRKDP